MRRRIRRLVLLAAVVGVVAGLRAAIFAMNERTTPPVKPVHDDSSSP
jgi:hypothetical protein